ncbi:MAG: energy transducer TonB [Pseudomonas sp.]|nr:energy transducer TonB [Pseudomonas sp.]
MLRLLLCLLLSLGLHALCAGLLRESLAQAGEAHAPALPQVVQLVSLAPLAASPPLAPAVYKPRLTAQVATPEPAPQPLAATKVRRPPKPLPVVRQSPDPAEPAAPAASVPSARPVAPTAVVSPASPAEGRAPAVAPPQAVRPEVLSLKPSFAQAPPPPRYPAQARRRNQQGVVLLEVRLDARGAQRELTLLRSSGVPSLDQAALAAVSRWRFRAEMRDGQAVPSRVHIPIEFALTATR